MPRKNMGSGGKRNQGGPKSAKDSRNAQPGWLGRSEPPKLKAGTVDRRAEAAKWAAQRTADLELAGKMPALFEPQYVEAFKKRLLHYIDTIPNEGHWVEIAGRSVYKQRFNCPSDYRAAETKAALAEVFGDRIPGIVDAYDRFVLEKRKTSFEEFQKWAQGLIDLKKSVGQAKGLNSREV